MIKNIEIVITVLTKVILKCFISLFSLKSKKNITGKSIRMMKRECLLVDFIANLIKGIKRHP
jgi:hypothetical protein